MKVSIKHRIRAFVQEELASLLDLLDRIIKAVNDNPYAEYEDIQVVTKTTEFTVTCKTLNRIPSAYSIVKKSAACDVYTSSPEKWKNNLLYLKASTVATVTIRVT